MIAPATRFLTCWLLAVGPAMAADAPVYRCGQTYQQLPCEGGQALDATDDRSADQRRDAQAAAAVARRQAAELAAERHAREKQAPLQRQPMGTGLKPVDPPASAPKASPTRHPKKKHAKPRPEDETPRYLAPPPPKSGG
jgi:hypothetical protein